MGMMGMTRQGRGFTLIELLVVIAIIALLIGILLPALSSARQSSRKLLCLTNIRQIATALGTYATDWEGQFPPNSNNTRDEEGRTGVFWYHVPRVGRYLPQQDSNDGGGPGSTISETVGGGVMTCPNHPEAGRSYTMNFFASSFIDGNGTTTRLRGPSKTVNMVQMRGFGSDATRSTELFVVGEAWGLSGVRDEDGEVSWFTNSTVGAQAGMTPFRMFGGGMGVSDFPGNWDGTSRSGPGQSPEYRSDVGVPRTYIPYYRHPQNLQDTYTFAGDATFGFVDGHSDAIGFDDLVNESTMQSRYRVRWSEEDERVELMNRPQTP